MPFKYLDLVRIAKPEPKPGIHILGVGKAEDELAFFTGAVGRVIGKIDGGYTVWFPIPHFPEKGKLVEMREDILKLHRGAMEQDYELAHFPGGTKPAAKAIVEELLNTPIKG